MARFNEILTGRHNRFMQKLFQLKGGPPAPQLSSDLQMVHPIFHGAENRYLESWNRFAFSVFVAAVAAVASTLRIRNPAGSNVILVLERANVGATAADVEVLGIVTTNADLVVNATSIANRIDARQANQGPSAIVSNSDATHLGSGIVTFKVLQPGNTSAEFIQTVNQEIPVLPGGAIDIYATTVNTAINAGFVWRERALEEAERF